MVSEKGRLIDYIQELGRKVERALNPLMPEEWIQVDVTMPQLRVLFLLFADGPTRMRLLASNMGITMATATGIVDRLVERGLVMREGCLGDRRAVVCRLTKEGQELIDRLWQSGQSRGRDLLQAMSPAELLLVTEAMETVIRAAAAVEQGLKQPFSSSEIV